MSLFSSPSHADFEPLVAAHTQVLLRTALRLTRRQEEAEDAVQETFLRAWKYYRSFEPGTNARAWLFRILMNVINRSYAGKPAAHHFVSIEDTGLDLVLAAPSPPVLSTAEALEALDRLPVEYKPVMLLVLVEEFSYREAADILEIPIGTVMSRLHRGRRLLRAELAPRTAATHHGNGEIVPRGE